jgi:hypothetical protein
MLTKKKITDRIWIIYGAEVEDVPRGFIRFQEYYENKDLKGKIVSVQQIEEWWEKTRDVDNTDSYYQYWSGFNIPGSIFAQLIDIPGFHHHKSNIEENELINLITEIPREELPYSYIIGMWKDSTDVLDHELAHALFGTNSGYKIKQIENVSRLPKDVYNSFSKELLKEGYHRTVLLDEMQAYMSTYTESLKTETKDELIITQSRFETPNLIKHTHPFVEIFKKFMPS